MSVEIRPCPGIPGYSVTADGRVLTHLRRHGSRVAIDPSYRYELRPSVANKGYLYVSVRLSTGRRPKRYVHALVLEAFVGPRPRGGVARHLDGNPKNNTLGNLAWGTVLENAADRQGHGRYRLPSCKRGHPYDARNTYQTRRGERQCRACNRDRARGCHRARGAEPAAAGAAV